MKAPLLAATAAALLCAASAWAQPPRPDPNAPFEYDPAVDRPYGAPLREAGDRLKAYYDGQHRRDPSLPDFEEAFLDAARARKDELVQVIVQSVATIMNSLPEGPERENIKQLVEGRDFNSFSRAEQEAIVGQTFGFGFNVARVENRAVEGVLVWLGDVFDRMAVQIPEGNPDRVAVRQLVDSAQVRTNYTHGQRGQDIDRSEGVVSGRQGEIVDKIAEEARRNPDMFRGGGRQDGWVVRGSNGEIYISDRGEIGASVRQPDEGGEMTFELREFRTARQGVISNAERDRVVAYIRENFPYDSRAMIEQFDNYVRRVNLAHQRQGGGGTGGNGSSGASGGFLPTVFDDFLDNGGTLTTVQLAEIYRGYDPDDPNIVTRSRAGLQNPTRPASEGRSLVSVIPSFAPRSPSALGNSPSLAGTDYRDPAMQEINDALYGLTSRRRPPREEWGANDLNLDLMSQAAGNRVSVTPSSRSSMGGYGRRDELAEITTQGTPFNRSIQGDFGLSTGGFEDVAISGALTFDLFDFAVEDGDIVALAVSSGGRNVLTDTVTLTNAGRSFAASAASGLTIITITAQNTGSSPPNTGALNVTSPIVRGNGSQSYNLNTGQTGALRVLVLGRRARTR